MAEAGRERHQFARALRNNGTPAERALWFGLRKEAIGFKFSRQVPIGRRIADFCCRSRRVVVEIDGASHQAKLEDDETRDAMMVEMGYVVLRFTNEDAVDRLEQTLEKIRHTCEARPIFRY